MVTMAYLVPMPNGSPGARRVHVVRALTLLIVGSLFAIPPLVNEVRAVHEGCS